MSRTGLVKVRPCVRLAAFGLGMLALAGCTDAVTHFTPAPARIVAAVDCRKTAFLDYANGVSDPSAPGMGSIPEGFVPVAAVKCTQGPAVTDAKGSWRTVREERLSGNLAPLVAALDVPSDRAGGNTVCAAMLELIPDLWLVDAAGRTIHVQWPLTACRFSKPGTAAALDTLHVDKATNIKAGKL